MTVLYTKDFSTALGGDFTDEGGVWSVSGGELFCSTNNFRHLKTTVSAHAALADVMVTARRASGAGFDACVCARSNVTGATSNTGNMYFLNVSGTNVLQFFRRIDTTNSQLGANVTATCGDGDTFSLKVVTTDGATVTLTAYVNGVQVGTVNDTAGTRITAAGQTGFVGFAANSFLDDFSVDDLLGGTATLNPLLGALAIAGRTPSTNPFTNVRIRELLISESGTPVGNKTGIHLKVWYAGRASGAPDLSYSDMTTDAAGTASWSIAPGSLAYNQAIFYVADDGSASISQYTCARMIPSYE